MRVLCVARHPFLSDHLGRYFLTLGVDTVPWVGLGQAADLPSPQGIDAVICDYELLAPLSPDAWSTHPLLSSFPVIAVSFTRHPGDAHLRGSPGLAAFFYLPTLEPDVARATFAAISRRRARGSDALPWLGNSPVAPQR